MARIRETLDAISTKLTTTEEALAKWQTRAETLEQSIAALQAKDQSTALQQTQLATALTAVEQLTSDMNQLKEKLSAAEDALARSKGQTGGTTPPNGNGAPPAPTPTPAPPPASQPLDWL